VCEIRGLVAKYVKMTCFYSHGDKTRYLLKGKLLDQIKKYCAYLITAVNLTEICFLNAPMHQIISTLMIVM
jgi:hypothetical protein